MQELNQIDRTAKYQRNAGKRRHRTGERRKVVGPLVSHAVTRCDKVALRFLKVGTVVRAQVPYAEGTGHKVRPAVVVAVRGDVVEVVPCTTSPRARSFGDVVIVDLADAGLTRHTMARTARHAFVPRVGVIAVLGHLSEADQATVFVTDLEAA